MMSALDEIALLTITGEPTSMAAYRGQVILVVNVASRCGFTPQYAGLQMLYQQYHTRGFTILAFPCNQFAWQEPADCNEIATFCQQQFAVQFPLFAKTNVNGRRAHPLFRYLKRAQAGCLGTKAIKWNFTKFLLDRQGHVVARFAPSTMPETLAEKIESLL